MLAKGMRPKCKLENGDTKIDQEQKFIELSSILSKEGNCENETGRGIRMAKIAFRKLSQETSRRFR